MKQSKSSTLSLSLIIVLGGIISLCSVYRALVSKNLIDYATTSHYKQMMISLCVLGLLIVNDIIIRAVVSALSTRSATKISNSIQQKVYSHIINSKWIEFSKFHSGDTLTRMTSDVDAVTNMLVNLVPNIISLIVLLVASFITLLSYDPLLAVLTLIISPVPILLGTIYAKKLKFLYTKVQETESKYRSFLNESIQNLVIVKSFCLEDNQKDKVKKIQGEKLALVLKRNKISIISNSVLSMSSWLGFFLVFSWGGIKLSQGVITFGTLTAMLQLIGSIQGPFSALASSFPQVISAIASSERIIALEELELDTVSSFVPNHTSVGIEFQGVSFSYIKDIPILNDISSQIYPGEIVALIGPSGQGKTTIIRLLLSLIHPKNGHVYVTNNKDRYEVTASTRKLISYVPQGNTLFSGTIEDNLRYGSPEATDAEIITAARAACAWEFIEGLENGLHTVIGERGLGLSEGQAQRLAIARALIRKTPILILDEATSALDIETEIKVLSEIQNQRPMRTCLIITHRSTALKICNRAFKLEHNNLIEFQDYINDDIAIDVI
jgi:ATP-binding cassette subfamily B protein